MPFDSNTFEAMSIGTNSSPPSTVASTEQNEQEHKGSLSDLRSAKDPSMLWKMRWFFAALFGSALLLSIPASIIIAIITKSPLPALVPTPLLLSMRPIIRWLFPPR